jgi:hypothetical protein
MKRNRKWLLAFLVIGAAATSSMQWSQEDGFSLSIESAQARVGRPATPVSAAGVARRTTRRTAAGAAAVGAAAVTAPACVRVLVNGQYVCR